MFLQFTLNYSKIWKQSLMWEERLGEKKTHRKKNKCWHYIGFKSGNLLEGSREIRNLIIYRILFVHLSFFKMHKYTILIHKCTEYLQIFLSWQPVRQGFSWKNSVRIREAKLIFYSEWTFVTCWKAVSGPGNQKHNYK